MCRKAASYGRGRPGQVNICLRTGMPIRKPFKILIGMLTARIIILPLLNQFLLSVAPSVSFLDGRLNGSSLTINMAVGNISMFRLICSIILYLGMLIFFIIHNNIYIYPGEVGCQSCIRNWVLYIPGTWNVDPLFHLHLSRKFPPWSLTSPGDKNEPQASYTTFFLSRYRK
jgi:hypothetical protein